MALQNKLQKAPENEKGTVEYECGGQMVKLSPNVVRAYLTNGNGDVTDQEVLMFTSLCKFQRLNPFLREAYLIKYGNQPATIVTGKEALQKRAMRNPSYSGHEAGVVVLDEKTGKSVERIGTIVMPGEKLIGGWAKVYVKGWETPLVLTVAFEEYVGRKSNGEVNSQWATKPATMIRKVALVQTLREAFPEDLGGMHAPEEVGMSDADLPNDEIPTGVIDAEIIDPEAEPAGEPQQTTAAQALFGN